MIYSNIILILIASLISAALVYYSLPKILLFSLKKKLLDKVDYRKVHSATASRLGGAAFFPAILVALVVAIILCPSITDNTISIKNIFLVELVCVMVLYIIGLVDDTEGIRYRKKFIFQFITAIAIVSSGNYIYSLNGFLGIEQISAYISFPLTIILIVFITNAINLIDGIDGLASLLSIIAFGCYGLMFYINNDILNSIIAFVYMGALLPFFYHNVFGIRKNIKSKIFMGDGGALVIGFTLAIMAIKLWNSPYYGTDIQKEISFASWVISYTVLLIPCFDVIRVILHRFKNHRPLFLPDKSHFHHKLMAYGFTAHKALILIVFIDVLYILINLSLLYIYQNFTYIVLLDILLWVGLHTYLTTKINRNKQDV